MDPTPVPIPLTDAEKRAALAAILASQTFARSRQLQSLLRYIAEKEICGAGSELTQRSMAVEALGRNRDFSPTYDASVRNRASLLRRRMQTYYAEEEPGAMLRIDLPRGSYCPVFQRVAPSAARSVPTPAPARNGEPGLEPVLREVWGPLVIAEANPLICIATPAHLMVRPDPVRVPNGEPGLPAGHLLDWFHRLPSVPPAPCLYLRPAVTSILWGDCVGALTAARLLTSAGAPPEILQEAAISIPALRNRNVVLIGRADYSKAVELLMRDLPFQIRFRPEIEESAVVNLQPRDGEPSSWDPVFSPDNHIETVYGLITVMPSKSADPGRQRTIILSGAISPGAQAAAEFLCSPKSLAGFKRLLINEGFDGFPDSFQIVVKAQNHLTMALEVSYVTHRVLAH